MDQERDGYTKRGETLTTTRLYATPASTSKSSLKTNERREKTPPKMSTAMKNMDIPLTSPNLYIS